MAEAARKVEPEFVQRRQAQRDLVDYKTAIIRPGNLRREVQLVDISPLGFHAKCSGEQFSRGESVSLLLPLIGIMQSRVMWSLRGCFGGQFLVPIDARAYLDCLNRLREGSTRD
jgi:hypothetical protein